VYFDLGISFKAIALNKVKRLRSEVYLVVIQVRLSRWNLQGIGQSCQWRAVVCTAILVLRHITWFTYCRTV